MSIHTIFLLLFTRRSEMHLSRCGVIPTPAPIFEAFFLTLANLFRRRISTSTNNSAPRPMPRGVKRRIFRSAPSSPRSSEGSQSVVTRASVSDEESAPRRRTNHPFIRATLLTAPDCEKIQYLRKEESFFEVSPSRSQFCDFLPYDIPMHGNVKAIVGEVDMLKNGLPILRSTPFGDDGDDQNRAPVRRQRNFAPDLKHFTATLSPLLKEPCGTSDLQLLEDARESNSNAGQFFHKRLIPVAPDRPSLASMNGAGLQTYHKGNVQLSSEIMFSKYSEEDDDDEVESCVLDLHLGEVVSAPTRLHHKLHYDGGIHDLHSATKSGNSPPSHMDVRMATPYSQGMHSSASLPEVLNVPLDESRVRHAAEAVLQSPSGRRVFTIPLAGVTTSNLRRRRSSATTSSGHLSSRSIIEDVNIDAAISS